MRPDWKSELKKHGFWFVDIPRTSSSSIRTTLGKQFGRLYGKSNLLERKHSTRQVFRDHITAARFRKFLGVELWNSLYTFTLVRNPWERTISMYFFRARKGHFPETFSFRDYVFELGRFATGTPSDLFRFHGFYLGCCDYIMDGDDNLLLSYIGKYENRQQCLSKISATINCPGLGKLTVQPAARNKGHYSNHYRRETRNIIAGIYAKDIEWFDYEFESDA